MASCRYIELPDICSKPVGALVQALVLPTTTPSPPLSAHHRTAHCQLLVLPIHHAIIALQGLKGNGLASERAATYFPVHAWRHTARSVQVAELALLTGTVMWLTVRFPRYKEYELRTTIVDQSVGLSNRCVVAKSAFMEELL